MKKRKRDDNDGYSSWDSDNEGISNAQFDFESMNNNQWFMKDHQRNYCTQRFREYYAENVVKQITNANPAPHHGCFRQIEIDSDIDDGLDPAQDKRVFGVRKQDNNYNVLYLKLMRAMGPLCRMWDLMDDVRTAKVPMEVNIHRMLTLIEQTITLMGQVATTVTYQRRLNYLRLFIEDTEVAKEKLRKHQGKLSKRGKLFGKDFSKKILGLYDKSNSLIQLWEQKHAKNKHPRGRGRGAKNPKGYDDPTQHRDNNSFHKRGRGGRGSRGRGRGRGRGNYANQGDRLVLPLELQKYCLENTCGLKALWQYNSTQFEHKYRHSAFPKYSHKHGEIRNDTWHCQTNMSLSVITPVNREPSNPRQNLLCPLPFNGTGSDSTSVGQSYQFKSGLLGIVQSNSKHFMPGEFLQD